MGWDYITSITETSEGGVIGVGSFSSYSDNTGIDVNEDGESEEFSLGSDDGLIVDYDIDGNLDWSMTFGGTGKDEFLDVVQTSDGGFAIVGSTDSQVVYYDGTYIEGLSSSLDSETLGNKDAVLIKVNSSGSYEWGVRFGGTLDDEATAVIETSDGNIAITGTYYSSTFNFLNTGSETVQASITKGSSTVTIMNGFVASYTSSGTYSWSQNISGSYDSEVVDITETSEGITIAVNHISTVYLDTSQSTSQEGASTSYVNGTVVGYGLDGTYSWRYRFYPSSSSYNVEITSLSTGQDDEIYVGVNHAYILYGGQNGSTGDVIYSDSTSYYAGSVVEITNTGEYTETIFTLDSTYDDYISDIVATYDGGILLGGWFYSTSDFTVGNYTFSAVTGDYTSDGFVMKLDSEGNLKYANQYAGDGYDNISTVTQNSIGSYYIGGSTTSTELEVTELTTELSETILTSEGNADGFISSLYTDEIYYTITVHYYVENSTTSIIEDEEYEILAGTKYTIEASEEIDSEKYKLSSTEGKTSGRLVKDVTIIYYYTEIASIKITKISSNTKEPLSGVEFSLYRLICEDSSHEHNTDDDLIDVNDYDASCWELFGTYTTDENGEFTLSELPIKYVYRLVETKTIDDYLLPSGQWEIELDDLDEDLAITIDKVSMQITGISNPPAVSSSDETLYLYNNKSYDIPLTGFGTSDFYKVGIILIVFGLCVIIIAKLRLRKRKVSVSKIRSLKKSVHNARRIINNWNKKN